MATAQTPAQYFSVPHTGVFNFVCTIFQSISKVTINLISHLHRLIGQAVSEGRATSEGRADRGTGLGFDLATANENCQQSPRQDMPMVSR
jgi:hypothetical protein